MYTLEIINFVKKDFNKVDKSEIPRIITIIRSLPQNPFPSNKFKKLKGSERSYRLRIGNYRILYEVDRHNKLITVFKVRHRKDVYKK